MMKQVDRRQAARAHMELGGTHQAFCTALMMLRLIADKQHVHMNSTRWETLTNFVKYLGKSSQCIVDETEKVRTFNITCRIDPKRIFWHS
jgi:hypothetical protein